MSQGCDTPKTQIPKLKPETIRNQNYPNPKSPKPPKTKTNPNPQTQNYTQIPKHKTQMFWVSFGIGKYLLAEFRIEDEDVRVR
jgi:hypothetical protein